MDAGDDRHGAGVDGLEHVGHRHRVLFVALGVEAHRRPHPGEVGPGTERRAVAGQDDRPELRGSFAGEQPRRSSAVPRSGRHRTRCGPPAGPGSLAPRPRRVPSARRAGCRSTWRSRPHRTAGDPVVSRGRRRGPRRADRSGAGRPGPGCRTSARPRAPTPRRCRSPPPRPTASAPRSARAGSRGREPPAGPTPSSASRRRPVTNNEAAATIRPSASPAIRSPVGRATDVRRHRPPERGDLRDRCVGFDHEPPSRRRSRRRPTTRMARSGDSWATTSSGAAT